MKDTTCPTSDSSSLEDSPGCIWRAIQVLGDKWTGLIVSTLYDGSKRFSELENTLTGISPRTLSQRLDKLQELAVIAKEDEHRYMLTAKGRDLSEILEKMAQWGGKYA